MIFLSILLTVPILFGLLGFLLPSFGYFPILDKYDFNLNYFYLSFAIPGITKSIILSFFTGFISTLLALFFSQVIILYIFQTKFYQFLKTIISPLLALPHVTMAIGLLFIFSPSGLFFRLFSPWLTGFERPPNFFILPDEYGFFLILGLVLKEIPFFILVSMSAIEQFGAKKFLNVGKSLQHSTFSVWCILLFPLIYKRIRLIIFIVIAFAASVLDMSLLLAPSTPSTLAIRILQYYQSSETDSMFIASNLALIQLFVIVILLLMWLLLEKLVSNKFVFTYLVRACSYKNSFIKYFIFSLILILLALSLLTIISSFLWGLGGNWFFPNLLPTSINIEIFVKFFNENKSIILISIFIPLIVSLLSCLIVILWVELTESFNKKYYYFESFIFLPLFIPQISFLIGIQSFLILLNFSNFFIPLIIVELFYVIPYSFIILAPSFREIKKDIIKVAASLGKNRFERLIFIKIPIIMPTFLLSIAIGMLVSFALYTPVYFIGAGRVTTLTVEALNLALSGAKKDLGVATIFQIIIPIVILLSVSWYKRNFTKWNF
ncbi:ABC transporter permease subunit [Alphaproteobacteria bacterium]|nr:ABC transporter permease subunit [Alphaproteobacteria bacterium]